MRRPILTCVLFAAATAALVAQEPGQASPYEGTSTPPGDETIQTSSATPAKPRAGKLLDPAANDPDAGLATVPARRQTEPQAQPRLNERVATDPDADIVHPHPLRPGELGEGTAIRVRLMERLSTAVTAQGQGFRSRVASDVLQGDHVLIPAGAEIDGRVVEVSSGHVGGHGSMRLKPEMVILPDGSRYKLYAQLTGAPGSKTKIGMEGEVRPGSQLKRDGVEYGGAVGAGAATGGVVGGPVGAVTGGLIGAGVVTAHLLINHPQAVLETNTVLMFTLTEPLYLSPAGADAN